MAHDRANRPARLRLAACVSALLVGCLATSAVNAQGYIRSPNLNIAPRIPTINPSVGPRVNVIGTTRTIAPGVARVLPYAHYSPNLYPVCGSAYRDGECLDQSVATAGGDGSRPTGRKRAGRGRRDAARTALTSRTVAGELVAEIDGALSDTQADELARRHGMARIASQNFPLIDATIGLFGITDRRSVETVSRELAADASVRAVQPNFRYLLQEQRPAATEGDPAQYAIAKLRLADAHTLSHGANVTVAVIDSGIDARHPELANSVVDSFDARGGGEGPHVHGTGVAGAIVAHARLMGSAPAARILAIRAFGRASNGAESNSFVILRALDYAAAHGARVVNMSFAGARDPLIERSIAAVDAKGIVMVAAAGNAGAKSPPLYPAANPDVIAVGATDAQDKLFSASNRGGYIALVAPGVDIFLPAPDGKYQMTSGTSFSAAYVSGLAALMLERNPALKPQELRAALMKTARDLGSPGRDDLFGAGEADAYAAVQAAIAAAVSSLAASESGKAGEIAPEGEENPAVHAPNPPIPTMASDKPGAGEAVQPAAR